jgi:hypothetical protein
MCLPEPEPLRAEAVHAEVICGRSPKRAIEWRGIQWRAVDVDCDVDRGADATTGLYQVANPRRHVSLRVLLRLTAMDVCCGPPPQSLLFSLPN